MYFDALILALIQATPFTYRDDCSTSFDNPDVVAYHRIVNEESHINFCKKDRIGNEVLIHEIGHEVHHIIRNDPDFEKYVNAFQKLYDISKTDADYVSKYAQQNVNEDFAETIEFYYLSNKKIPSIKEGDWISPGISNIQRTKYLLIDLIIKKLQNDWF